MTNDADRKRDVAKAFGDAADGYRDGAVLREGADLERLVEWSADASKALDVATGAGHVAGALAEAGVETVVAGDLSPEMVRTARREHGPLEGAVVDAERLPFDSGRFDAVTCRFGAHHFPDPAAFLAEVERVLAPGGTLALADLCVPDDADLSAHLNRVERVRDPGHVESYSRERWLELLAGAGLFVEDVHETGRRLDVQAWLDRMDVPDDRRRTVVELLTTVPDGLDGTLDREYDGERLESYRTGVIAIRASA